MEKEFEILNHTADVGIIAYGSDINEAFANAAKGMFSLITDSDVEEIEYRDIEMTSPDQESLLVKWLNELIYYFDAENMLFKRFDITQLSQRHLKAKSYGQRVTDQEIKIGIKAATYHMLKIDKNNGCRVQVVFDI
ncbi:MAG: archease [Dehalococcoidales bacterium]|nr:archease [Dehalococcoidales bacterium]